MANCTYTIDGKEIKGVEGLKAWLVNGGLESLYPDGSWVQAKEPGSKVKTTGSKTEPKYSKGQSSGSTVEQIKSWLPRNVRKMLDAGKLRVVQSVDDLPANLRGVGEALFHTVFHGTPHDFDRFSLDKIGTGEGAQAFGYGLYMTSSADIAKYYRDKLSGNGGAEPLLVGVMPSSSDKRISDIDRGNIKNLAKLLVPNPGVTKLFSEYDVVTRSDMLHMMRGLLQDFKVLNSVVGLIPVDVVNMLGSEKLSSNELLHDPSMLIDLLSFNPDDSISSRIEAVNILAPIVTLAATEVNTGLSILPHVSTLKSISTKSANSHKLLQEITSKIPYPSRFVNKKGKLYQVELAPTQDEYLDWDKPLSEQSDFVKNALEKGMDARPSMGRFFIRGINDSKSSGMDSYNNVSKWLGSEKAASDYLHSLGIRGIRYNAEGGKSDANNYVIFSDDDISITAKYSKLSGVQGLYDNKSDTVYLVADMLDKGNLQAVLSHELYHRGLATDKKLQDAHNRFMGDMQRRYDMAAKGIGSKADKEAYARVQAAETPAKDRLEEFAAYQISAWQQTPDSISSAIKKAIQDFIAAIRAFLVRSGLDFGYIQSLTAGDLAALSKYGARVQFDGVFTNNEQGEKMNTAKASADIRYSVGSTVGANPKLKDSILYNLQDRFIDLKNQIEKVVKNGGTISEDSNPYMAEELYHQRTASRIKEFYDKELNPLLKKLHDSGIGLDRFQEFLHARHAPSRNAVMAERNPNQAIIDAKLKDAEESLEAVRNNPTSTRKELSEALAEYNKWRRAKPFDGTEEERLSLSGMSNQEARDFLNNLTREEKSVLEPLGDMIDAINEKTLDTQIEYGMETQDSVDALKNQWKHYVPLHRDEAHEDNAFGHPIGRGFSVRGSGMKNATGSNAEVTNILAHIAAAREQMLRRGEKNKVTVALAKFIEQNPDKDFAEINKVDFDKKLNDDGLVESQMEPIFKRNQKDNVVMFRVNGKDQAIVFNEKKPETVRLAMSLKNLDGASLDAVESLIAKGTRWMASVNTQYNIIFGIVNLLRDVQGMMLNLSSTELHGKQRKVFNRLGAAMTTIYNEERGKPSRLSGLYERFNKSGGTTGYTQFFDDIRARNKSIEKEFNKLGQNQAFKIGDAALQWLRDYNTLMENATRFAVFMEAVDSGMSDAKAASLAKNITVNFNRKGAQATKVGAFYAFFNASAQGTARLVETMKGPQGKKIAGGGVLLGAITTLLGMMAMGEDEWEKIPEFVRERSIVIPTGGSNYASIPMPLGFHILPNIGRKLVESAFGSKKVTRSERLLQLVGATANAFNPLGGNDLVDTLSPTVLDPAVALMRNQDWTGRQIYSEDFSGLNPTPGFTRKKDSASKASTLAAEFINKATGGTDYKQGYFSPTPDQIDYIFGQFFGGTGREALKLDTAVSSLASGEELPLHKIPLVGRLYGETKGNAVERSAYYENIKRMNEHHAEIKGLSKESNGTMKVRQYLKENPEASLYVKAKAVQRRIDRLNDQRKILVKAGSKTSTIDNQIAAQMKVLNDAINVKINR